MLASFSRNRELEVVRAVVRAATVSFLSCMFLFVCVSAAHAADWDRFNWEAARPAGNTSVRAMAAFAGNLYVGTEFPGGTAQAWRYNGAAWTNISPAWPASSTAATAMVVFQNLLFVGTQDGIAGAQMWRMTAAEVWTQEAPGWVVPANWAVSSMAIYDDCLYVGLANAGGCRLWRRTAGGVWNEVNINGSFSDVLNTSVASMATFNNWLYAGTRNTNNGAKLWRIGTGLAPSLTNHTGFWGAITPEVSSLCAFGVYFYIGTERSAANGGAQIWETPDGLGWLLVVAGGFGNTDNDRVSAMFVAGLYMYAGARNLAGGESCVLYRSSNGFSWYLEDDDAGLDNPANNDIRSFAEFSDEVYCGTSNATGSEVYRTGVVNSAGSFGSGGGGGDICFLQSVSTKEPAAVREGRDCRSALNHADAALAVALLVLMGSAFLSVLPLKVKAAALTLQNAEPAAFGGFCGSFAFLLLGCAACLAMLCGCAGVSGQPQKPADRTDEDALPEVPSKYLERVKATLAAAGDAKKELLAVLNETSGRTREWAAFLIANLPPRDRGTITADVMLDHLHHAELAFQLFPWTQSVPENVFLHYVLPYRVSQEPVEKWRGYFLAQLHPRLKDKKGMTEAALELNRWAGENVKFKPTEFRDQGPLETLRAGYGRCEEMMIVYIAAARSVGLPARCVSTPWWATCDNNHAWVEVWTEGAWHYLGACEPAATLDEAWFRQPARRAAIVYSACFGAPETDEIVHRRGTDFTYVNATPVYSDTCTVDVTVVDSAGSPQKAVPIVVSVFNYGGFRPITRRTTDESGKAKFVLGIGQYFLSTGAGELQRAWKILDTGTGKPVSRTDSSGRTRTELQEHLVLGDQAPPEGRFWLRYPGQDEHRR